MPGDGIDNDCDGKIDEEVKDGKDDDNDGRIDEDLDLVITMAKMKLSEMFYSIFDPKRIRIQI